MFWADFYLKCDKNFKNWPAEGHNFYLFLDTDIGDKKMENFMLIRKCKQALVTKCLKVNINLFNPTVCFSTTHIWKILESFHWHWSA
jgi:hypothetical protein